MEKIAIVGLSCLLPDAQSPDVFWENLMSGKDSTSQARVADFGTEPSLFYDPTKGNPDKTYSLKGGYIRDFAFDATGYCLAPDVLTRLDPLAQASLYAAKQALQHSGDLQNESLRSRCGLVLGNLSFPTRASYQLFEPMYQQIVEPAVQELLGVPDLRLPKQENAPVDGSNAQTASLPALVVAKALGLSSSCFAIDAACSSSLYAIKLACDSLLLGQTDMMLAGAVSYADSLFIRMLFSGVQAYPDNGISRPLDQNSRGLTPADGVGMVVLKRLSDAVRDRNTIYGVIAGVGLSNDGCGKHLLRPNPKGQLLAFERAYQGAGLDAQAVDYVECHSSGSSLGDTTELETLATFFGAKGVKPLLGTAKTNVGHLLTAAGMVSLLKVLLAMEKETIPPTIHLETPRESADGSVAAAQIVQQPTPWSQTPKRAAMNAFGFGGTSAHLIVEESTVEEPTTESQPSAVADKNSPPQLPPLAIVGMDAFFGDCDGLDAFDRCLYDGTQQFKPLPTQRWRGVEKTDLLATYGLQQVPEGAYIEQFDIDPLQFKIPPSEVANIHPQQLLMLKVANRALQDAGLKSGSNVAVLVAMEMDLSIHQLQQRWHIDRQVKAGLDDHQIRLRPSDLNDLTDVLRDSLHIPAQTSEHLGYIGNIMASRIAALWDFNGPAFTVSAREQSVAQALTVAQQLLANGEVEAVLVGAVDLAGSFEQVLWRHQTAPINDGTHTWHYDQETTGWTIGEGSGAVVLKRADQSQTSQDKVYAVIDAIALARDSADPTGAVAAACGQTHQTAAINSIEDIGYLEICGGAVANDTHEIRGLTQAYQHSETDLTCAMGSASAIVGHTGIAAAMASLIKTALCLYHRYLPAVPQWSAPKHTEQWQGTPFYVAQTSRPWLLGGMADKRIAAINQLGEHGTSAHIILSEDLSQQERPSRYLAQRPFYLFAIAAQTPMELQTKLESFQRDFLATDDLAALAHQTFKTYQQETELPYTLTLVGGTRKSIERDLRRALPGITKAFETGEDWQSPSGSYFTANPQGQTGQVAFVYPGAFSAYVGLVQDMFRLFPKIYDEDMLNNVGSRLNNFDRMLYPRSLTAQSRRQQEALELELLSDPLTMFEAEIGCAGFTTSILQNYFQLQPQVALGHSLGETSMMLSLGVFDNAEVGQGSLSLNQSSLFGDRLSGPKNAVREYWRLPTVAADDGQDLWCNHVLMAAVDDVKQAVATVDQAYLTQINTPNEVVIAGAPEACETVVKQLGCPAFRAPFDHVIHCAAMASEKPELVKLNSLTVQQTPSLSLYSASNYQPMTLNSQAIGQSIAQNLCQPLDFPRLVNQVYQSGARIFVEVGAGATCSRWIGETLKQQPHLTVSLNLRGMDNHTAMVRALARLVSHGVPLDLSPLYVEPVESKSQSMVKTIQLGGINIVDAILTEQNKLRLQRAVAVAMSSQPLTATQISSTSTVPEIPVSAIPEAPTLAIPEALSEDLFPQPAYSAVNHEEFQALLKPLYQTDEAMSQAHSAFLKGRQTALQNLSQMVSLHLTLTEAAICQTQPETLPNNAQQNNDLELQR